MEHISKPVARVVARLGNDMRLRTLFPPNHRVRAPRHDGFFRSREEAAPALDIDHGPLLDVLWKLRSLQTLCGLRGLEAQDPATRTAILSVATFQQDVACDLEILLARKAEAELWQENAS